MFVLWTTIVIQVCHFYIPFIDLQFWYIIILGSEIGSFARGYGPSDKGLALPWLAPWVIPLTVSALHYLEYADIP